jgi:23S rRNA (cytidine1920-2'-O)/16S rRNA (cytidine1409-2'-O)-methyltransferase
VVALERVNARNMESLPEPVSLITVDVSFIGLEKVLPALRRVAPGAELVVLFKPQFEVGRGNVGKGGVVRDDATRDAALREFLAWVQEGGFSVAGSAPSRVRGAKGNQETFVWLRHG